MVRFPVRVTYLLFFGGVQTGPGFHPSINLIGIMDPFPEVRRPGREADQSPASRPRLRISGAKTPLYPTYSWHAHGNFALTCILRISFNRRLPILPLSLQVESLVRLQSIV